MIFVLLSTWEIGRTTTKVTLKATHLQSLQIQEADLTFLYV